MHMYNDPRKTTTSMFVKPEVDLEDPRQNEFVQEYLSAYMNQIAPDDHIEDPDGYHAIELTVELVQEIYSPHILAPDYTPETRD